MGTTDSKEQQARRMNNEGNRIAQSARELKNIRSLAAAAMILAVAVILGFLTIQVTPAIKIGFSGLADEFSAALFGPVVGGISGGLADVLKYLIKPTGPYFPGFTISGVIAGVIYGVVLYRRPVTLPRVILANSLVTVFVNMLLNTYWLTLLYGNAFRAIFPLRAAKELAMLPVHIAVFYLLAKAFPREKLFRKTRQQP